LQRFYQDAKRLQTINAVDWKYIFSPRSDELAQLAAEDGRVAIQLVGNAHEVD
jgi:hypothetical protein